MDDVYRGQVNRSAAEVYDQFFLPALFGGWTGPLLDAAGIEPGHSVLDVACGTGVLTLAAAERLGPDGSVVGLDINEGMLAVARRKAPDIDWRHGRAERLPFPENRFDRVLSQFGLMFFDDQLAAIREMTRVLRPAGRLGVAVWDSLENTPGYAAVTRLLQRLFGARAADALRAPYTLGDTRVLAQLFSGDGLVEVEVHTRPGTAVFPSVESWMYTDVKGWTLAGVLDEAQYELLLDEANRELKEFVVADGSVAFPAPAHIVTATKI